MQPNVRYDHLIKEGLLPSDQPKKGLTSLILMSLSMDSNHVNI